MRKVIIYFLLGFVVMILSTYIAGLYDDAFKRIYHTGVWYMDILNSFKYYVLWVLPYWWLIILIGTVMFAFLFFAGRMLIDKLR